MGASTQSFSSKLQMGMAKFASNKLLSAVANGMIRLLPITMVGSLCAILANLGFPVIKISSTKSVLVRYLASGFK